MSQRAKPPGPTQAADADIEDVIIIGAAHSIDGAGLYGIAAARTYLEVHPECRLVILEQDHCVGGVWNAVRNYEVFWVQAGLGMAEYSDVPLRLPPNEETYHDIFRSKHVTKYLEEYIDTHAYSGRSLRDRIIFDFSVSAITKEEEIWIIRRRPSEGRPATCFRSRKLMIATGMTSEPNIPTLPDQKGYSGQIIHQKDFGRSSILLNPSMANVAVLGAGKSAADMVYAAAKAGKIVSWIIRQSGNGPTAFIDVKGHSSTLLSYKNAAEIGHTRLMTAMGPSCFQTPSLMSRFIHKNFIGKLIGSKVWKNADRDILQEANYHGRPRALKGYEQLEPSTLAFWCNGPVGLLQHPDFWDTVAQKVQVYRSDILRLDTQSVHLENGISVPCDTILCGTGWKHSYPFFTPYQLCSLGLPHSVDFHCLDDATEWMMLQEAADCEVLKQFPRLAKPPRHYERKMAKTPYRLYQNMAPLDDDSIVFLGQIRVANGFRVSECQALWATAYLDGNIELPSYDDMQVDIAYVNAFCRRRYPANGAEGNFFHYEVIGYTDNLLAELRLSSHRKKGRWNNFTKPCFANDMRGLVEEYLQQKKSSEDNHVDLSNDYQKPEDTAIKHNQIQGNRKLPTS